MPHGRRLRRPAAFQFRRVAVFIRFLLLLAFALVPNLAWALTAEQALAMARGDSEERIEALNAAAATADPALAPYVQAMLEGEVQIAGDRALIVRGGSAIDPSNGQAVALPEALEDIIVNNRMRRELGAALAALRLFSPDRAERLAAIEQLKTQADESRLPLLERAAQTETDEGILAELALLKASALISSPDRSKRLAAAALLADSQQPATRSLLLGKLSEETDHE